MFGLQNIKPMKSSRIASFAVIGCSAFVIFLVVSAIVLGLIPVYIESNTVATNADVLRSKEITMSVEVEENDSAKSGRRKRDIGDLYEYVGGEFDDTGKEMVKQKLLAALPSNTVSGLSISNISLGYEAVNRRRRFALTKRAAYISYPIVLVIKFYIIYFPRCIYQCQIIQGPILRRTLYNMVLTPFIFTNVPIYKNGLLYSYAPRIKFVSVIYISVIIPGVNPSTPTVSNVTIILTSTAASSTSTSTISVSATPALG